MPRNEGGILTELKEVCGGDRITQRKVLVKWVEIEV